MQQSNSNGYVSRRTALSMFSRAALAGAGLCSAAQAGSAEHWQRTFDIVIVGSGGAGLTAALSAWEAGARHIAVIEKLAVIGGNTALSSGYFNAVDPARQKPQGIEDSIEHHIADTLLAGGGRCNPALVQVLCENALDALHWLEAHGVRYEPQVQEIYGGLYPRSHIPIARSELGYVGDLVQSCRRCGIPIYTQTALLRLAVASDPVTRVTGVEVRTADGRRALWRARKAVILCAGGFSANRQLRALHDPRLAELPTTNSPGCTGEVMLEAEAAGGYLIGCDMIECIPGSIGDTRHGQYALYISRCLFVNRRGERFIREDERRDVLRDAVLALPEKTAFAVLDQDGVDSYGVPFHGSERAYRKSDVIRADTLEELAVKLHVLPQNLVRTVEQFNLAVRTQVDVRFGRKRASLLHQIVTPPFYGYPFVMSVHHTMGGVEIDAQARVLDVQGQPIEGLYAAGEITGGIHGLARLGGNAVCDIHVFGRLAGQGAAREAGHEL